MPYSTKQRQPCGTLMPSHAHHRHGAPVDGAEADAGEEEAADEPGQGPAVYSSTRRRCTELAGPEPRANSTAGMAGAGAGSERAGCMRRTLRQSAIAARRAGSAHARPPPTTHSSRWGQNKAPPPPALLLLLLLMTVGDVGALRVAPTAASRGHVHLLAQVILQRLPAAVGPVRMWGQWDWRVLMGDSRCCNCGGGAA